MMIQIAQAPFYNCLCDHCPCEHCACDYCKICFHTLSQSSYSPHKLGLHHRNPRMLSKYSSVSTNDTALKGNLKVKIPKYFCYAKNRDKNKGGVATVVAEYLKPNTTKVTEGREGDEYIITRIDITAPALNVINIYGSQEGRVEKDEVEKSWLRLLEDINDIEDRNEDVINIWDLNRAVGSDAFGVKANKSQVSYGGELIRNLLKTERYVLINNLDMVQRGPWTWVDRQDASRKSCLNLCIVSVYLVDYVSKVIIDTNRKFTPRRIFRNKLRQRPYFLITSLS